MYKICFDKDDNIIGFDLENPIYYINLLEINNVEKEIDEIIDKHEIDSLGRKIYLKINTGGDVIGKTVYINDNNFTYKPSYKQIVNKRMVKLIVEPDKFTIDDILQIKKDQLISKYECSDCILFELFNDDNILKSGVNTGKNIINLCECCEVSSNKINIDNNSQISIYYESNNNLEIYVSDNNKNFSQMLENEFININKKNIYLKIKSHQEVDIFCIAILLKK